MESNPDKGSCTYYVITDRGGSLQMITVLHREGSSQMITVIHRGVPENDYSNDHKSWVITSGILFPQT